MKKSTYFLAAAFGLAMASCNNAADKDKKTKDTTNTTTTIAPAGTPFTKEVTYDKYKFTVTTAGEGDQHHFKIIPSGLTEANDTLHQDVKGTITNVIINDIDGDNSPEIGVIDVSGTDNQRHLHVFTTFNGKSIGYVNMPELPNDDKALAGYKGGDEYEFVENTLVRRFPIYEGENKTGKMRQLQYKLQPGEAMKQLVLDKTDEF
jgi:hypothetical protein